MSEIIRDTEIHDSFTVLDEINELSEDIMNKEDIVENENTENDETQTMETTQNDKSFEDDLDMCEIGDDENQVQKNEDCADTSTYTDDICVNEKDENCVAEQDDTFAEELIAENNGTVTQAENVADLDESCILEDTDKSAAFSTNLDETGNLQDTDVSGHVDEDESEKAEQDITHPYLYIIETFEYEKEQLNLTTLGTVKTLEETPFIMVTTRIGLMKMLQSLRSVKEIGLNVVKDNKEFAATICLILISTRDTDYCIDGVKLQHDLLLLTEIFINPKILKIIASAKSVLACLQQNLHLYMVNIFDIQEARNALFGNENGWSVYSILKTEYNYERIALKNPDLRKRPLPEAYKTFFRAGPHYLIYMYHDYKNRLILKDRELYKKILDDGRDLCKVIFSDINSMSYQDLENELKKYHNCELEVLKKIYDWRSTVAQKKNIKREMVLHKYGVLNLVRELPTETDVILKISKSRHVREDVEIIKDLINEVRNKYHIVRKSPKVKKAAPLVRSSYEPLQQGNIQLKRKFHDQTEMHGKQKRFEQSNDRVKSSPQNNLMKGKLNEKFAYNQSKSKQLPQNKNLRNKQNILHQNKNQKQWVDKPHTTGSFLNTNRDTFNASKTNKRRFQSQDNRYTDTYQNDETNLVFLNPTSVPSSFTFQTNSSVGNNISTNRNGFDRELHGDAMLQMTLNNLGQSSRNTRQINQRESEEESLYRSLVELKQARDNITMQTASFTNNFKPPRYQDLNTIDHKINNLERRIQQTQARNRFGGNVGNKNSPYTRRY